MKNQRNLIAITGAASLGLTLFSVLTLLGATDSSANPKALASQEASASPQDSLCGEQVHYYRHDLPPEVNQFGPPVLGDAKQAQAELRIRRCLDPALVVAHQEYSHRVYSTPFQRLEKTVAIATNQQAWALTVQALEEREATAVSVEIVEMSEQYQTMYMTYTSVPTIFKAVVDRPRYSVLRYTYADGTTDNYKLDCGYQPVSQEFPGLPTQPPSLSPPHTPSSVVTPPPTTSPPTTVPCSSSVCKGIDRNPAPCIDNAGVSCTGIPGSGGSPGTGGAISHGDDGYSPQDPPPTTIVRPVAPPSSVVTLPPTTIPPTTPITAPPG